MLLFLYYFCNLNILKIDENVWYWSLTLIARIMRVCLVYFETNYYFLRLLCEVIVWQYIFYYWFKIQYQELNLLV